jgi:hypothetical protein
MRTIALGFAFPLSGHDKGKGKAPAKPPEQQVVSNRVTNSANVLTGRE